VVLLGLLSGEEVLQFVSATVALEADRGIEDNLIFCLFKVDCIGIDEILSFERLDLLRFNILGMLLPLGLFMA
jgi:hypothetical protein